MDYLEISTETKIRYQLIAGKRDKPFLVFLHEGLGCIEMWKDFPLKLCRETGCPGVLYDRAGYGKSSPEKVARDLHYVHDYAFKELPEVLASLLPDLPYLLVGHSDGGSIALIHASTKDPWLKGIVTEAAHVFVEDETLRSIHAAEIAFNRVGPRGLKKYHGEKTQQVFKTWSETWLSPWFRDWSIERMLPEIACPVLVLQGVDDEYGTRKQLDAIVSQVSGPVKGEMIPDCGHTPHFEQQDKVSSLITGFIREITKSLVKESKKR